MSKSNNFNTNEILYEELEKSNLGCFSKVNIQQINSKDNPDLQLKMRENKTKLSEYIKTNFAVWDGFNLKVPDINEGRTPSPVNRLIKHMKFLFSDKGKITHKIPFMRKLYESEKSEKLKQMRRLNNLAAFEMTKVKNPEQALKINLDYLMKDLLPQERIDFIKKNEEFINSNRYLRASVVKVGSEPNFDYGKLVLQDKNIDSSYDSMKDIFENLEKLKKRKKKIKLKLSIKFNDGGILKSNISKKFNKGELEPSPKEGLTPCNSNIPTNLLSISSHSNPFQDGKLQFKKTLTTNFTQSQSNRLNSKSKTILSRNNDLTNLHTNTNTNTNLQTQVSTQCNDSNLILQTNNIDSKSIILTTNNNMSYSDRGVEVKNYTARNFNKNQNNEFINLIPNYKSQKFTTPNQFEKQSRNKIKFASEMTHTPNTDFKTLTFNQNRFKSCFSSGSNLIRPAPSKIFPKDISSARQSIDLKFHQITNISKKIKKDFTKNLKKLKTPLKKNNQINESFDKEVAKELNNKYKKNKKIMKKTGMEVSPIKVRGVSRHIDANKATLINITDKFVMMNENMANYLGEKIKNDYEQKAVKAAVSEELEFRKNFAYDMNKELTPTMTLNNEKMKKIQYNINRKHKSINGIYNKIILTSPLNKCDENVGDDIKVK